MIAAGIAGGLLLAAAVAIAILRKRRKKRAPVATAPTEIPAGTTAPAPAALGEGGDSQTPEKRIENQIAEREALQQKLEDQALASLKLAPVITKKAEVFAKHLREKIAKEPDISVQILRSWIREEDN